MKRQYFTLGFEFLEQRHLMALPSSTMLAEHSAEVVELPHVEVSALAVAGVPSDVSLSVEADERGFVLMVQLHDLDFPRMVGIHGGPAAWTDSAGTAGLLLPPGASRIELTITDHPFGEGTPFLRVELDQQYRIARYERILPSRGIEHDAMPLFTASLLASHRGSSSGETNSLRVNPSANHHANNSGRVESSNAFNSVSGRLAEFAGSTSQRDHSHRSGSSGATSQPTSPSLLPSSGAISMATEMLPGTSRLTAKHHRVDFVSVSPVHDEMPEKGEPIDVVFAEWGEEVESVPVAELAVVLKSSSDVKPLGDDATALLPPLMKFAAETPRNSAVAVTRPKHASAWQIASAIAIAVASVGVAVWLERRARKASRPVTANITPVPLRMAG